MLTFEQKVFFISNGIKLDMLFDAQGKALSQAIKQKMKAQNKLFAYNTAPCNNGHTFKTRSGHCIKCQPASIQYMLKEHSSSYIYIAGSLSSQLIKIGITEDIQRREYQLNSSNYGNISDWMLLFSAFCRDAGRVERSVISILRKYQTSAQYYHDGKLQTAKELLKCNYKVSKEALIKIVEECQINLIQENETKWVVLFNS